MSLLQLLERKRRDSSHLLKAVFRNRSTLGVSLQMPDRQKVPQRQTFTKPNTTSMMRREEREPRRFLGTSALSPEERKNAAEFGGSAHCEEAGG